MNALANSQANELEKFLCRGFPDGQAARHLPALHGPGEGRGAPGDPRQPAGHPADQLRDAGADPHPAARAEDRQRGPRTACASWCSTSCTPTAAARAPTWRCSCGGCATSAANPQLQCVGTSATLAGGGTLGRAAGARSPRSPAASSAQPVEPERVIGETLRRATRRDRSDDDPAFARCSWPGGVGDRGRTGRRPTTTPSWPIRSPPGSRRPSGWPREAGSGRLRRADCPAASAGPEGAAGQLAALTGAPERPVPGQASRRRCWRATASCSRRPASRSFAFRLHQFISRGDTVYASLEDPDDALRHHPGPAVRARRPQPHPAAAWPSAASAARSTTPSCATPIRRPARSRLPCHAT